MSEARKTIQRPLSPHLQVYRWAMGMSMSILHRATGYALAIGTIMVVWLLLAAASGPDAYRVFSGFAGSPLGQFMLFGWSVAMFYHMCNGLRHLFWDCGKLFRIGDANKAGLAVLAATLVLTAAFWAAVCGG